MTDRPSRIVRCIQGAVCVLDALIGPLAKMPGAAGAIGNCIAAGGIAGKRSSAVAGPATLQRYLRVDLAGADELERRGDAVDQQGHPAECGGKPARLGKRRALCEIDAEDGNERTRRHGTRLKRCCIHHRGERRLGRLVEQSEDGQRVSGAGIDLAVGDSRNGEPHERTQRIAGNFHLAVVELMSDVRRIVGVQRPAASALQQPHDAVGRAVRGDRRDCARVAEHLLGLRCGRRAQSPPEIEKAFSTSFDAEK